MINELIGTKAIIRKNRDNETLCVNQGLDINEVIGYVELIDGEMYVNVKGNRLKMKDYKGWDFDSNAERQFTNGTKAKLMEVPINQIICESINRLDLIGFEGEIQYLSNDDVKHGYYVVGDKEIIYMRNFPRWEFI